MATPLIEPVARLIESFARLPGIGPKTAQRLTYHLLRAPDAETRRAETERFVSDLKKVARALRTED